MINNSVSASQITIEPTSLENIPQQEQASFKQKIVKIMTTIKPYVASTVFGLSTGIAIGYITYTIEKQMLERKDENYKAKFDCYREDSSLFGYTTDKIRTVCLITSAVSGVLSPLLYTIYHKQTTSTAN